MKQGFQLIILGLLGALFAGARPSARAQDVHPETTQDANQQVRDEEEQNTSTTTATTTTTTTTATGTTTTTTTTTEEEEEDNGPKRFWRKSSIFFDQGVSGWTLTHEGHTYNPTSSTLIRFTPRVYLNDEWFIRLRQDFSVEETQSDSTNYNLQPIFGDGLLDVMHPDVYKNGDLSISLGARITIPWSQQSQANRTFFGIGGVADATYSFPHVLEGFSISLDAFASYYVSDTNIAHLQAPNGFPCSTARAAQGDVSGLISQCDQTGGNSTTAFNILYGPIFSLGLTEKLNLSIIVFGSASLGRNLAPATVSVGGAPGGAITFADGSTTHWRNLEVFYLSLTYSFTKFFDLSLNYYAFTNLLDPQGNWRDPFWGPDQEISVTAFFTLDQLYNAITGETHDPARAQRARTAARAAGGML